MVTRSALRAMRRGFSQKELSVLLGIRKQSVHKALEPALEKIAKLWIADPQRAMLEIFEYVKRLEPLDEVEFDNLARMANGRADLKTTHPLRSRG